MPLKAKLIKTLFLKNPDIKAADIWIALCKDYVECYSSRFRSFFFTNPHLAFVKTFCSNTADGDTDFVQRINHHLLEIKWENKEFIDMVETFFACCPEARGDLHPDVLAKLKVPAYSPLFSHAVLNSKDEVNQNWLTPALLNQLAYFFPEKQINSHIDNLLQKLTGTDPSKISKVFNTFSELDQVTRVENILNKLAGEDSKKRFNAFFQLRQLQSFIPPARYRSVIETLLFVLETFQDNFILEHLPTFIIPDDLKESVRKILCKSSQISAINAFIQFQATDSELTRTHLINSLMTIIAHDHQKLNHSRDSKLLRNTVRTQWNYFSEQQKKTLIEELKFKLLNHDSLFAIDMLNDLADNLSSEIKESIIDFLLKRYKELPAPFDTYALNRLMTLSLLVSTNKANEIAELLIPNLAHSNYKFRFDQLMKLVPQLTQDHQNRIFDILTKKLKNADKWEQLNAAEAFSILAAYMPVPLLFKKEAIDVLVNLVLSEPDQHDAYNSQSRSAAKTLLAFSSDMSGKEKDDVIITLAKDIAPLWWARHRTKTFYNNLYLLRTFISSSTRETVLKASLKRIVIAPLDTLAFLAQDTSNASETYIPELYLQLLANRTSLNFEKLEIVLKQLAGKLSPLAREALLEKILGHKYFSANHSIAITELIHHLPEARKNYYIYGVLADRVDSSLSQYLSRSKQNEKHNDNHLEVMHALMTAMLELSQRRAVKPELDKHFSEKYLVKMIISYI